MATVMVNARVAPAVQYKAAQVLKEEELTISAAIQGLLEYIAESGVVPDFLLEESDAEVERRKAVLEAFLESIENTPCPGYDPNLTDDDIKYERLMRKYGYLD